MARTKDEKQVEKTDKLRVLVVEDYADAREMYAEYLSYAGFEVEEAENGKEAVDKATDHPPDAILMDLSLPVMDGWQASRLLKKNARTRDIPVLAVSAHALSGTPDSAFEAGCDDFVPKPAYPQDVEGRLRSLLRKKRRP